MFICPVQSPCCAYRPSVDARPQVAAKTDPPVAPKARASVQTEVSHNHSGDHAQEASGTPRTDSDPNFSLFDSHADRAAYDNVTKRNSVSGMIVLQRSSIITREYNMPISSLHQAPRACLTPAARNQCRRIRCRIPRLDWNRYRSIVVCVPPIANASTWWLHCVACSSNGHDRPRQKRGWRYSRAVPS